MDGGGITLLSGTTTLLYDANGNETNNGSGQTYEWDVQNQLTAINYANGNRSEFTYDGQQRRVKIVEKANGTVTATRRQFIWTADVLAESGTLEIA